jgi:hypothetical protein
MTTSFHPSPRKLSNFFGLRNNNDDQQQFSSVPSFQTIVPPDSPSQPVLSASEVLRKAMFAKVCVIRKFGSQVDAQVFFCAFCWQKLANLFKKLKSS